MKKIVIALTLSCCSAVFTPLLAQEKSSSTSNGGYPYTQVPFTAVKLAPQSFWGQRMEASRNVTIPLALQKCEETDRYRNFSNAAEHLKDNSKVFDVAKNMGFPFDDTDPYKTLEGVSYLLQIYPDKKLEAYADSVIAVIASAQESDGYLFTARTQNPEKPQTWVGHQRWERVETGSHELYNLGHLCEAAVAHYYATGKKNFLTIAEKYADCVCREIGDGEGQKKVIPGHQIAEMGLCKLYLATGNKKYLDQAKFFLDARGKTYNRDEYNQTHKPVLQQKEAVGHAVRAGYMYAGMADVAALTGDADYIKAIDGIWDNIVTKKYYIMGGVGARHGSEAFGANYELPNLSAYNETCAAIANVYFNYRLFLLHGESKYYDVLERTLYNAVISGISMDGGKFFYPNPLASDGGYVREPWFGCACCPSNVARFIPSLPQYIYAVKDDAIYVNLFASSKADVKIGNKKITLEQQTNYPWDGDIALTVKTKGIFKLKVRIPGWAMNQVVPSDLYRYTDGFTPGVSIAVNGSDELKGNVTADGYCTIDRKWKKGDVVSIHFDMKPRTVVANEKVEADRGCIAVERGPLVYCAEWADNGKVNPRSVIASKNMTLTVVPDYTIQNKESESKGDKSFTVTAIKATGLQYAKMDKDGRLAVEDTDLTLIPYYAWDHRGGGKMTVWLSQCLTVLHD